MDACFCYITDNHVRYVTYTRHSIASLRTFIPSDVPVFVLTDAPDLTIPEADWTINISSVLRSFGITDEHGQGRFPALVWAKFLLPFVPEINDFSRSICYDPDTIAVSAKVNDLLTVPFNGHEVLATTDDPPYRDLSVSRIQKTLHPSVLESPFAVPFRDVLLNRRPYANAGLTVLDLDRLRATDDYSARLRWMLDIQADYTLRYPEQDWMNIGFSIRTIPSCYSHIYQFSFSKKDEAHDAVWHYTNAAKKRLLDRLAAAWLKSLKRPSADETEYGEW